MPDHPPDLSDFLYGGEKQMNLSTIEILAGILIVLSVVKLVFVLSNVTASVRGCPLLKAFTRNLVRPR